MLNRLKSSVGIVAYLFGLFGSFLIVIAPPEQNLSKFALGISSFIALFILLYLSTMKNKKFWRKISICAFICFLLSSVSYYYFYDCLTVRYPINPPNRIYITGTELSKFAKLKQEENPMLKSPQELLLNFGGVEYRHLIWPIEAQNKAKMILLILYISLITSISTSLFSLVNQGK